MEESRREAEASMTQEAIEAAVLWESQLEFIRSQASRK